MKKAPERNTIELATTLRLPAEPQTEEVLLPEEIAHDTRESKADTRSFQQRSFQALIILTGSNLGQLHRISKKRTVVGRSTKADIPLLEAGVSRQHFRLDRNKEGQIVLTDMGSTNGTFCNGERVQEHRLEDGDRIQIGTTVLKFTLVDQLEETAQKQLFDSALRDGLTQAFNRRYFQQRIESEFTYSCRYNTPVSLVFIDFDQFKQVTDEHGTVGGDYVLSVMIEAMASAIRTEDVLCRFDEAVFAVICRGIDLVGAKAFGERLRRLVEVKPILYNGARLKVTLSVGTVTMTGRLTMGPDDLVEQGIEALEHAKLSGRNCVFSVVASELSAD